MPPPTSPTNWPPKSQPAFTPEPSTAVVADTVRSRQQQQVLCDLARGAELKALRAQINPHFLFNALNAIAGLIREQPARADDTIEQLAQVFRYTLRKPDNEWGRLDEEVDFVTAYLRVEQARFGDRLQVSRRRFRELLEALAGRG